ncbi:MAG: arsenite S-adenosylmethyltransferase [Planctomycetes bacterium SM23_32]|nr:MAG: arsenite S-adenosylmethyltransferase [Planctomycetes bacterium SM23_32]
MAGGEQDQDKHAVRETVRRGYAEIARSAGPCCGERASCGQAAGPDAVAGRLGYGEQELAGLPEGANMGLSCGNPATLAALKPGEVVLDLGSGGGLDVFIAARNVGPTGRAIGVDMTPEMISKAPSNVEQFCAATGLDNVEFCLGEIEHLPVPDASVDCVISNCVINLSPDKPQVWREIARVLRPGGRVAVSDLALLQPLPPALAQSVEARIGCMAGAVSVDESVRMAREAGLAEVEAVSRPIYSGDPADWGDRTFAAIAELLPEGTVSSDYVVSMDIRATRPEGA